jgi:hypothetical protein
MSRTTVSAAGVSEMISAIVTANSRLAAPVPAGEVDDHGPLLIEDSMTGPSCSAKMYVQDERTLPIRAKYTRMGHDRNAV